jgi:hypothetical protein
MPNCTYCGKPAGLLRTSHPECRAQFERAVETIPAFFEKLLHSHLPAERFEQLLREVAATFHVRPQQLQALSVAGINAMMAAATHDHLLTLEEEERILEIAEALKLPIGEIDGLEDKLVKIDILRELDDGQIPDRITVAGPMPIELEAGETIIWIFNRVKIFRSQKSSATKERAGGAPPKLLLPRSDMPDYLSPAGFGEQAAPTKKVPQIGIGDLVVTSRNIFILFEHQEIKLPLAKIGGFQIYADGLQLARRQGDERPTTLLLDDPWFAANLLLRLARTESSPDADTDASQSAEPAV